MFVLAGYIVAEIPDNLKNLIVYKQKNICHTRWVTTANEYLRMFFLEICPTLNETSEQNSFIYHISLIAIVDCDSIEPKSTQRASLTLSQRSYPCLPSVGARYS